MENKKKLCDANNNNEIIKYNKNSTQTDFFRKNMDEAVDFCIKYMGNPENYSVTTSKSFFNFLIC